MARIGIVPLSGKPYHLGHSMLIDLASAENDRALLFVSTSDRGIVSGRAMAQIWKEMIEPSLPENVEVTYGGSPVGNAYAVMGKASEEGSQDTYVVYSDVGDEGRFDDRSLRKYVPNLNVIRRGVPRSSTVDISGTKMRDFLTLGDKESFLEYLPPSLDGNRVWDLLFRTMPQSSPLRVRSEALLRGCIRMIASPTGARQRTPS